MIRAGEVYGVRGVSYGKLYGANSIRYFSSGDNTPSINPEVEERVMELIRKALEQSPKGKPDLLDREKTFEELGLDSLDTVDLIVELEENLGVDITNEEAEDRLKRPIDAVEIFTKYLANKPQE